MELIKNIFFNTDKLIENSVVKISYTGKFFQDNSNTELYIHYGFGLLWENVNEIKMERTELGYQALIYLNGQDSLNFCFKNGKGEWDNNNGKNYVFEIAPLPKDLVVVQENGVIENVKQGKFSAWWQNVKASVVAAIKYLPKLFSFNTNSETVNEEDSSK